MLLSATLRYFEEIARLGSIRRASETLNIAGSALSRQLAMLEDEVGAPLFERRPRGLRLLPAGEALLRRVRRWRQDEWQLQNELAELQQIGASELRIAAIEAASESLLPMAMAEMNRQYGPVRYQLTTQGIDALVELVAAGEADVGIVLNLPEGARVRVVHRVAVPLGAVMEPQHPLAKAGTLRLRDCRDYPMVLAGGELAVYSSSLRALQALGLECDPIARCNRIMTIKSACRAGLGISVLTALDVTRELASGELVFVPLADRTVRPPDLSIFVPAAPPASNASQLFVQVLRKALRDLALAA